MSGSAALKLDEIWDEAGDVAPIVDDAPPHFAEPGTSPVAAMQHQLHQAALRGFFDKAPVRWQRHHRLAVVTGMVVVACALVYATVSHLSV